jgi:hypothetical protein
MMLMDALCPLSRDRVTSNIARTFSQAIPVAAVAFCRIVSIRDVFGAVVHNRPIRKIPESKGKTGAAAQFNPVRQYHC